MKEIKPVKRSEQLAPFSREHHDALLFTWKIKQGLKNGSDVSVIADYVHWYWNNNLSKHFEDEEQILLPYLQTDDELAAQLRREHESIRRLIREDLDEARVSSLAEILNAHIRFEERKLFPHIEHNTSTEQLNMIFEKLDPHPHCQATWDREFWVRKNG